MSDRYLTLRPMRFKLANAWYTCQHSEDDTELKIIYTEECDYRQRLDFRTRFPRIREFCDQWDEWECQTNVFPRAFT
jgi:hypothetical protein